jgi:hypothetical protein
MKCCTSAPSILNFRLQIAPINNVRALLFQKGLEKSVAKGAIIDRMAGYRNGIAVTYVFLEQSFCDIRSRIMHPR